MRLSRESRYAIRALTVLARRPLGEVVEARELAAHAGLPAPYLSKIMQMLARGGVLRSFRGRGYELAAPPEELTVEAILRAVEGDDVIWQTCIFWREECDAEHPCPLHWRWRDLRPGIEDAIGRVTLAQIGRNMPPLTPAAPRPAKPSP